MCLFSYRWYIPLTWKTDADQTVQRQWFKNDDNEGNPIVTAA